MTFDIRGSRAVMVVLVLILSLVPIGTAQAAPTCFGREATIVGTNGNDTIFGTSGDDVIVGRDGYDTIKSRGGNDRVCGGQGMDRAFGGRGRDRIDVGPDPGRCPETSDPHQVADGYRGADVLIGTACIEKMWGGAGPDRILGNGNVDLGTEYLIGGRGDDRIDVISEGFQEAYVNIKPGPGRDEIEGDGSLETVQATLDYSKSASPVAVDLAGGTATGEGVDRLAGIEFLVGSNYADTLIGSPGTDNVRAGRGDDDVVGHGGDDDLDGNDGDDSLDGGDGSDNLDGGSGQDRCVNGETVANCE